MKKVIAIAFSDLHIHKFRDFNEDNNRLKQSLKVLKKIIGISNKLGVPILFCGDLFHNPKEVENETLMKVANIFKDKLKKPQHFFAISGNHDMSEKNTLKHTSPTYINSFPGVDQFFNLDNRNVPLGENVVVYGIPYMNSDIELKKAIENASEIAILTSYTKKKILLLHSDFPGAENPMGYKSEGFEGFTNKPKEFFSCWDLVLMGHIHKPQKLGNNIYMLGSPIHQIRGDVGTEMGYWKIYEDLSVKFKPLNKKFPEFGLGMGKPGDYIIPELKEAIEEEVETGEFNVNVSRDKLAKRFCKAKGINSKRKVKKLSEILNKS